MVPAFYMPDFDVKRPALSAEEGFHAHKVLRVRIGEPLWVLDGKGKKYRSVLQGGEKMGYPLSVVELKVLPPPPLLTLMVAPPKQMARIEWLVEKSTELGLRSLHFIQTEHTERKKLSIARLERIAIAALKQSQQPYKLQLEALRPYATRLSTCSSELRFVATLGANYRSTLPSLEATQSTCSVLIGPEGGLSPSELQQAQAAGFQPFSLGPYTLRTETAALVVLAQLFRPL